MGFMFYVVGVIYFISFFVVIMTYTAHAVWLWKYLIDVSSSTQKIFLFLYEQENIIQRYHNFLYNFYRKLDFLNFGISKMYLNNYYSQRQTGINNNIVFANFLMAGLVWKLLLSVWLDFFIN
jgi:hypothetical protein